MSEINNWRYQKTLYGTNQQGWGLSWIHVITSKCSTPTFTQNGICVEVSLLSPVTTVGACSEMLFIWVDFTWITRLIQVRSTHFIIIFGLATTVVTWENKLTPTQRQFRVHRGADNFEIITRIQDLLFLTDLCNVYFFHGKFTDFTPG